MVLKRFSKRLYYGMLASGLAVLLIYSIGSLSAFSSCLLYPFLRLQTIVVQPVKRLFTQRKTIAQLEAQVAQLSYDNQELIANNIELHASLAFANETKELRTFKEKYNVTNATLSRILIKHISPQEHFMLVAGGLRSGIQLDMVAVHKNNLIGKVVQVFPFYSKVQLISDRSCKVAAYCARTKASGIHEGENATASTAFNYVSHLVDIKPHDLIISSGDGLVFPQGFALGKIKRFRKGGLYYQIDVEPLLDINELQYCYLVQKS